MLLDVCSVEYPDNGGAQRIVSCDVAVSSSFGMLVGGPLYRGQQLQEFSVPAGSMRCVLCSSSCGPLHLASDRSEKPGYICRAAEPERLKGPSYRRSLCSSLCRSIRLLSFTPMHSQQHVTPKLILYNDMTQRFQCRWQRYPHIGCN